MMKAMVGALACAASLACAGHASAAIMEADIVGGWDDNTFYKSWTLSIVYDTALATQASVTDAFGNAGQMLSWQGNGISPPPILSITGTFTGREMPLHGPPGGGAPIPDYSFTLTNVDRFLFAESPDALIIAAGQGANFFSIGAATPNVPACYGQPCPVVAFDQPADFALNQYNMAQSGSIFPGALNFANDMAVGAPADPLAGSPYTYTIDIKELSPTPEPATWALMLLGFFGLGGLLRAQRRRMTAA